MPLSCFFFLLGLAIGLAGMDCHSSSARSSFERSSKVGSVIYISALEVSL
jgi:hypothetical protein